MSRCEAYLRGVDGVVCLSLFEECWDGMLVAISTYPSELLHHGAHVQRQVVSCIIDTVRLESSGFQNDRDGVLSKMRFLLDI